MLTELSFVVLIQYMLGLKNTFFYKIINLFYVLHILKKKLTYLLIEDNGAETIVLSVSLLTVVTGADVGGQD